jgi:hypothetical protein
MCGRFVLTTLGKDLAERFGLEEEPGLKPRYNIAPTQMVAVIRLEGIHSRKTDLIIVISSYDGLRHRSDRGLNQPTTVGKARQGEKIMITALVQFKLRQPVTPDNAKKIFSSTAPKYRGVPGLIRKYYLLSEDGGTAGGVYLWRSREDADRLYTDDWRRFIAEKYGAEPSVHYFATPVVVDNLVGEIVTDA